MGWFSKRDEIVDWRGPRKKTPKHHSDSSDSRSSRHSHSSNSSDSVDTDTIIAPREIEGTTRRKVSFNAGAFSFFDRHPKNSDDSSSDDSSQNSEIETYQEDSIEERRSKLADRLIEMTNRLEDLSNEIYRLQQRLEVVERKLDCVRE